MQQKGSGGLTRITECPVEPTTIRGALLLLLLVRSVLAACFSSETLRLHMVCAAATDKAVCCCASLSPKDATHARGVCVCVVCLLFLSLFQRAPAWHMTRVSTWPPSTTGRAGGARSDRSTLRHHSGLRELCSFRSGRQKQQQLG